MGAPPGTAATTMRGNAIFSGHQPFPPPCREPSTARVEPLFQSSRTIMIVASGQPVRLLRQQAGAHPLGLSVWGRHADHVPQAVDKNMLNC